MKPKVESDAVGFFIAGTESAPQGVSGVIPWARHSFRQDITAHMNLPRALPAGLIPRMGGRLFLSPSYARWSLPRKSAVAECYTVSAGAESPSRIGAI